MKRLWLFHKVQARHAIYVAAALLSMGPAWGHHSYSMFKADKAVELHGVVTDWQFTNPHSWLELTVMEAGVPVKYSIEGSSPNSLMRRGWGPGTFKRGDKVAIVINPLVDGRKGGAFVKATLADGTVLTQFRQD